MRLFLLLAAACLSQMCAPAPEAAEAPSRHLKVLFTNDVQGYVEPCG